MSSKCPTCEYLVAYLEDDISPRERLDIDQHLQSCRDCVQFVRRALHRIRVAGTTGEAVPEQVRLAIRPVTVPLDTSHPAGAAPQVKRPSLLDWFRQLLDTFRAPLLIPIAAAAVALLVVARGPLFTNGSATRGPGAQVLQVTALEAELLEQPGLHGRTLASVRRGGTVTILGEQGAWFRVRLENGTEGWIDQHSFE